MPRAERRGDVLLVTASDTRSAHHLRVAYMAGLDVRCRECGATLPWSAGERLERTIATALRHLHACRRDRPGV